MDLQKIWRPFRALQREMKLLDKFIEERTILGKEEMNAESGHPTADASKLKSFAQQQDSDDETAAPEAAADERKSGGIVDTLNGLLNATTKEETTAKGNYDLKLPDEMKYATNDMGAESSEIKAAAEGDLGVSTKDLNEEVRSMRSLTRQSFAERQEHREAEINGLKRSLEILESVTPDSSKGFQKPAPHHVHVASLDQELTIFADVNKN